MKSTGVYLTFDGNCAEAFDFYKEIFGGDFPWKMKFGESPMKDEFSADEKDKIMHISLCITKTFQIMGCDYSPVIVKNKLILGNNTQVTLTADTKEEADTVFSALSKGGSMDMEIADQFWGAYAGACTDKFGIQWMVDFIKPKDDAASSEAA